MSIFAIALAKVLLLGVQTDPLDRYLIASKLTELFLSVSSDFAVTPPL
jgi:hypothetical protein